MESVDMGAEHHMGSLSARDATYDELDQEREASLEQEGIEDIDEFLKDVQGNLKDNGGGDKTRIKTLEKSLEDEKRRLAGMEMQLREAKRQRDAETQMVVVTKQSKMLETMMTALSKAAQKETGDRMHWEAEWRQRFAEFHGQHREMEEALKRKHVQELKSIKDEIQRNIRRVAFEVQRTKGKNMPSPRTLGQMQEENMGRILVLFHKHGQERLTLASKVAKQEEVLVQTKNRSLQKMMGQTQVKSTKLYSKVLPALKTGKRFELDDDADMGDTAASAHSGFRPEDSMSPSTTRDQSRQRSRTAGHGGFQSISRGAMSSSWSANAAPLPSPRIDYNNTTFLTGIEDEYESNPSSKHNRPSKVAGAGAGGKRVMTGGGTAQGSPGRDGHEEQGFAHTGGGSMQEDGMSVMGSSQNVHVGPKSYFKSPDNAQFAKGVPDPASYTGGGPAHLSHGGQGEYMTNPNVGQEFGGWAQPAPPGEEGRPDWNQGGMTHGFPQAPPMTSMSAMTQQWHPNIIAFDKSTTGYGQMQPKKAGTASPYLAAQPLSKKSKSARGQLRSKSVTGNASFSVSQGRNTMSKTGQSASNLPPAHASNKRTKEPSDSAGGQHSGRFPKISESGRQQATDQNSNRPYTELGKNDDFSLMQNQRIGKLETWIEDKIKGVLGNGASRENILDRMATASSMGKSTRAPTASDFHPYPEDSGIYPSSEDEQGRLQQLPRVASSTAGDGRASISASSRDGGGAVAGLMSKLKTSMSEDPKVTQSMSQNSGFDIEGRDEKMARIREFEASRKGVAIDQAFEVGLESRGQGLGWVSKALGRTLLEGLGFQALKVSLGFRV